MSFKSEKDAFYGRALFWIQSNLQQFDPTNGQIDREPRLKALSEFLFTCYLYKRHFKVLAAPFDEFVSFGHDAMLKITYSDEVHRKPELLFPYSIIYKSLRVCGVPMQDLKEDIQSMLNLGLPIASEDDPYRKMELRYALEGMSYKHLAPAHWSLYSSTSFHRPLRDAPPVLSLGPDQVHGLAHFVSYVTDFGFSARGVPQSASLRWLVSVELGVQALEKNWDAVAELMMCCSFLRCFPASIYKSAWLALLKAQKVDGALADNLFDAKKLERMPATEKESGYFQQHYHTTVLCAAAAFLADERDVKRNDPLHATSSSHRPRRDYRERIERAHGWLLKTYADQSTALGLPSLLYLLCGEWIASLSIDDHHPKRFRLFSRQVRDDIARAIRDSPVAVDECDPALVFLGEGILRRFDLGVPEFDALADKSAKALTSLPIADRSPDVFPVSYLLGSLGFELGETQVLPNSMLVLPYEQGVPKKNLLSLVNYISKVTSFGSLPFRAGEARFSDEAKANLITLTYHRLLHYNLDEGLTLLRAMNHAGLSASKPFEEAMMYVLAQQRNDGSFGFYADEIQLIRRSDPDLEPLQRIVLPTTVSAMWTIYEAMMDGLSLFASVRSKPAGMKRR